MIHLATTAGSYAQGGEDRSIEFCSYCGRLGGGGARVCPECGLGVRLHTNAGALRSPDAAFLIVRSDGRVSAASAAAERLLAHHGALAGKPLLALLTAPDEEAELTRAVSLAASGDPATVTLRIALVGASSRGPERHATIAACGPPPAALVVLERALPAT